MYFQLPAFISKATEHSLYYSNILDTASSFPLPFFYFLEGQQRVKLSNTVKRTTKRNTAFSFFPLLIHAVHWVV